MRRVYKRKYLAALPLPVIAAIVACSGGQPSLSLDPGSDLSGGTNGSGASGGSVAGGTGGTGGEAGTMNRAGTGGKAPVIDVMDPPDKMCPPLTCASLGYACGYIRDECGTIIDCAAEGLTCGALEACTGGVDGPTQCEVADENCTTCGGVPDCKDAAQPTRLTGRVITPGRDDANAPNQLGVPNAFVYILRTTNPMDLPPITSGIAEGGTSCDRCESQDLGPVLVSGLTDATGAFTLEGNIPVNTEFLLVVKVGRFRRAITYTLPETAACATTDLPATLPENPTRLPRDMMDGLGVNMPRIAVTTGAADGMECVLEKMGISHGEFANPGADGLAPQRVHLYQGGNVDPQMGAGGMGAGGTGGAGGLGGMGGAAGGKGGPGQNPGFGSSPGPKIDNQTPPDREIYGDLARLQSYDIVVADCEGGGYDTNRTEAAANGDSVREYVNRGGRFFASHLSYTWLVDNGTTPFDAADPIATGLGPAAVWSNTADTGTQTAIGGVSLDRPQASPRIQNFADWMVNEGITMAGVNTFSIIQPRSQVTTIGETTEEFVYETDGRMRVEQFSINTPYGAPEDAVCGRVAYSGFHVAASDPTAVDVNANKIFPEHCTGDLSPQEKVLLYMLFDLNACVGDPPIPPVCTPETCTTLGAECGFANDGCGNPLDCGPCPVPPPK